MDKHLKEAKAIAALLPDWRIPTKRYKLKAKLYVGLPISFKEKIRRIAKREGLSMSEVARRRLGELQ